jgi:hypothetical protein
MIQMQQPFLLSCLLAAVVAGASGCASKPSGSLTTDPGMAAALPPLDVNPALDAAAGASNSSSQPTSSAPTLGDPWPRQVALADATALVYLPQISAWKGNQLTFRAAVAIKTSGSNEETFGVIWGNARTGVDRLTRTVTLDELTLTQARFPTVADHGREYLRQLRSRLPTVMATMSLDLFT